MNLTVKKDAEINFFDKDVSFENSPDSGKKWSTIFVIRK